MNSPHKVITVGMQGGTFEGLKRELPSAEFQFQSAGDLEELVEILKESIPDLVYISADTKQVDPFGLCTRLTKMGAGVLLISQAPTRELLIKAARHGAMDVVVFPFQRGSVGSKTDRALIKAGKKTPPEGMEHKIDFGAAKTPYDKVKLLVMLVKEVLALPFAVVKIIRLCNDASSSAGDLEKPIMSDPAIAAMIMQRANAASFAGAVRTSSIQTAVMRIGMKATRNIASSFSVFKLFSNEEKSFGFNRIWFWVHSLTTGICAQVLAAVVKYQHPEDAFLAGLLHDIGKMVLDDFMNEDFERALRMANSGGLPMWKAEKAIFDVNHSYVGSKIAEAWAFPPVIAEGIGRHHLYENLASETGGLSIGAIVCLANQMAKALRAGSGGDHLAEREEAAIWKRFPKGVPWRKVIEKVVQELKAYTDILEIPPEQFEMDLPDRNKGKAGIFLPPASNNGILLQIALEREGFETVPFSSLTEQTLKDGFSLVVGDLTTVENGEAAIKLQKVISSLANKTIIVPPHDEEKGSDALDLFRLESQLKQIMKDQ